MRPMAPMFAALLLTIAATALPSETLREDYLKSEVLEVSGVDTNPAGPMEGGEFDVYFWLENKGNESFKENLSARVSVDWNVLSSMDFQVDIGPGDAPRKFAIEDVVAAPAGERELLVRVFYKRGGVVVVSESEAKKVTFRKVDGGAAEPRLENLGEYAWLLLASALAVVAAAVILIALLKRRDHARATKGELDELRRRKRQLEEGIKLAKIEYYKRRLDEESYREIVKGNEEKLIDVESRIRGLETQAL